MPPARTMSPLAQTPPKNPPAAPAGGGWGSLLSGAVAGLESRLDTILADDARGRGAADVPAVVTTRDATPARETSRSRAPDRLAERLARATASRTPSRGPSRGASPAVGSADEEGARREEGDGMQGEQQDVTVYLEKIDALQAKLRYLAKETVAAAQAANASTPEAARLGAKDEKIALLMEEGEKLSKAEVKHLQTIKALRARVAAHENTTAETKKKLDRAEKSEAELKTRLRHAELAERQAKDKMRQVDVMEQQVAELHQDRETAAELITSLTVQLKETRQTATQSHLSAAASATAAAAARITRLESDLSAARTAHQLASAHWHTERTALHAAAASATQHARARDLEHQSDVAALEARLEALRTRLEDASAPAPAADSPVKLLRQLDALQSQYALAKANWDAIEASSHARVAALEADRDDAARREAALRRRARDAALQARRAAEELDVAGEKIAALSAERDRQAVDADAQAARLAEARDAADAAAAESAGLRERCEAESRAAERAKALHDRLEAEREKSRRDAAPPDDAQSPRSADLPAPHAAHPPHTRHRPMPRRSPASFEPSLVTSSDAPRDSSIDSCGAAARGLTDLRSASGGAGAGPSVQLVERLAATVRRLEGEKAAGEEVQRRYEMCLEMLGEREEEVAELRTDVAELKRLYRELVEREMGG